MRGLLQQVSRIRHARVILVSRKITSSLQRNTDGQAVTITSLAEEQTVVTVSLGNQVWTGGYNTNPALGQFRWSAGMNNECILESPRLQVLTVRFPS